MRHCALAIAITTFCSLAAPAFAVPVSFRMTGYFESNPTSLDTTGGWNLMYTFESSAPGVQVNPYRTHYDTAITHAILRIGETTFEYEGGQIMVGDFNRPGGPSGYLDQYRVQFGTYPGTLELPDAELTLYSSTQSALTMQALPKDMSGLLFGMNRADTWSLFIVRTGETAPYPYPWPGPEEINLEAYGPATSATVVPEPSTLLLLGSGLAGLVGHMQRRQKRMIRKGGYRRRGEPLS